MDSQTSGTAAAKPRRECCIACLFLVGAIALGFGVWRLAVWGFGRPEQLLDIGDTRMKRLAEGSTEPAKRNVQLARERKDAIDPQVLAAAEEAGLRLKGGAAAGTREGLGVAGPGGSEERTGVRLGRHGGGGVRLVGRVPATSGAGPFLPDGRTGRSLTRPCRPRALFGPAKQGRAEPPLHLTAG